MSLFTVALLLCACVQVFSDELKKVEGEHGHPNWLVNNPPEFHERSLSMGELLDVRNDPANITFYETFSDYYLLRTDAFTDGEVVDALEHFFWGKRNGLAMELGALEGSPNTRSMTTEYEKQIGWKRILVEGDPSYRERLIKNSPQAFSANAAICEHHTQVHFIAAEYVGGIAEFMGQSFMKEYHPHVFKAGTPPGNVSSIDWSTIHNAKLIECIPLNVILHKAKVRHINYFILDVEGGELEVLKSINWATIKFDVLCIETEPSNRPPNYPQQVTSFLEARGYRNATGQQGRNIWYTHKDFVPSARPGLDPLCFNGARKSDNADHWWLNRKYPKFERCVMKLPPVVVAAAVV